MSLLLIIVAILAVFVLAFIASAVLTRLSGAGRVIRVDLGDLVGGRVSPGTLVETSAEVKLVEFTDLDAPPVLILTRGESMLQAVDPEGRLEVSGAEGASLMPSDPRSLSGRDRILGSYRVVGELEHIPCPHLKIRAARKN